MQMNEEPRQFPDLPAALVEEVIRQASTAGDQLIINFRSLRDAREGFRHALEGKGVIRHESDLGCPPAPTTCGADGSYAIERLLGADLTAAAAVAVEGLTPPSEHRHWDQPHHLSYVEVEKHHEDTTTVLRSLMLGRELQLASSAPHDVVMLDGTLTLPLIYFNQALNKAPKTKDLRCSRAFLAGAVSFLEAYRAILVSSRSDKQYIALPKYSTRREIGLHVGWTGEHDDRGLLTLLLKPGEYTLPLVLQRPPEPWHLNVRCLAKDNRAKVLGEEIVQALAASQTLYYKPQPWLPALRIEMSTSIASNPGRLAIVLQGLKHQCATAAMLEPYPLYLADRTVKALARAIPTFRQVATQRVSETYEGDIGDVFLSMHGYRSESGG